jgi:O-antigen/teichoic acid export membrane protein
LTKIRKLAGDTVLYGLGSIVPRFMTLILFPIHTYNAFDPAEYGVFTFLMSIVAFMNIIYSFGMETAYFRFATKPGADQKSIFNIALTAIASISLVMSLALIVLARPIAVMLDLPGKHIYIIWLAAIMFIDNISSIPFARLRLENKPLQFAFYKIATVVVVIILNLYFIFVVYDPAIGIGYIFLANLIANSLLLVFFFKTFISWRPAFDKQLFPDMIRYSYPVMLTGLVAMTNEFFSRVFLKEWLPENFYPGRSTEFAVGVFGASYRFATLMNLAVQAFRMAAEPFFFNNAAQKDSPQLFAKVNHYFVIVCCFIMLSVAINMDVLKYLMGESYWEGIVVVIPLSLGYMFLGIYYNLTVWYKLTDRTIYGTMITLGGAILTVVLNFVFIPAAGYLGSSWATVIVYAVMMIVCYALGQKYYPIPYTVGADLFYIGTTIAISYGVNSIAIENLWWSVAFHVFVVMVWLGGVFTIERGGWKRLT